MVKFRRSTKLNKKYDVLYNGKWISFGDNRYQHYYDKIGFYSNLNHLDDNRRKKYLARAKGIKDKDGNYTYLDKNSPNYWSVNYLW